MLVYIILVYLLLFVINMSQFERSVLYKFIINGGLKNVRNQPEYQNDVVGNGLKDALLSPFYIDRHKFAKITLGTLFNMYSFHDRYFERQREINGKMFWNDYFSKNGIKTPKLYATTNPYHVYEPVLPDREYIAKPEYGLQGLGVQIVKGEDVKATEHNFLIQEKIDSCNYDGARSFRVVTSFDGELLFIKEIRNDGKITSNEASGGTMRVCESDMCGEYNKIHKIVNRLRSLHVRDFDYCFCIGWDLLLDCNDVYVIEGNVPTTLFGKKYELADEFYDNLVPKAKKFYALNNI